ncbi:MAG: hypothetical protein EOO87_19610, partial [Pedobacter sp.]
MYKIFESRVIKDPFLVKEIVEFNYYKMYEIVSKNKVIRKPDIRLGTPYENLENIIQRLLLPFNIEKISADIPGLVLLGKQKIGFAVK